MKLALGMLAFPWIFSGPGDDSPLEKLTPAARWRRPIALILADEGKTLLIANRDSGTITVLDAHQLKITSETRIGRRLSDLAATPNRDVLLVTDEEAGEAIVMAHRRGSLREVRRLKVGLTPVSGQISDDGTLAVVACLWPRQLMFFDLAPSNKNSNIKTQNLTPGILNLPFAPRRLLLAPGGSKLIVADAFGGQLAVVDIRRNKIESVRNLAVHNIRGLALDRGGQQLLITHQTLNPRGHPTAGDIRAGNVIDNNLRKLLVADVLDPWADSSRHERVYPLGDVERGAGDPAAVAESFDGHILVTLAGVNELAIGRPEKVIWSRLAVGRRPTALAVDLVRRRAYVANTFADSISVVDLQSSKVVAAIPLGPVPKDPRPEERGAMLFYDARLSLDAWYSCHSCHPDGHSNGRLNDNFTDGSFGTPKRVLSLLGGKDTGPWAWNGRFPDLHTQVLHSLKSTMQGPEPLAEQVRDLSAFLRTLPPPPAVEKARGTIDPATMKRGRQVFTRHKCATCHAPPTYTSPKSYDVGLGDEAGGKAFNPPSLRGLSQAGPYFHDNRAQTLEEVFTRYRHELAGKLSSQELSDLLYFLKSI